MRGLRPLQVATEKPEMPPQVILPLVNNWNLTGGADEMLAWNGLSDHEMFFSDGPTMTTYRNTVRTIITWIPPPPPPRRRLSQCIPVSQQVYYLGLWPAALGAGAAFGGPKVLC